MKFNGKSIVKLTLNIFWKTRLVILQWIHHLECPGQHLTTELLQLHSVQKYGLTTTLIYLLFFFEEEAEITINLVLFPKDDLILVS